MPPLTSSIGNNVGHLSIVVNQTFSIGCKSMCTSLFNYHCRKSRLRPHHPVWVIYAAVGIVFMPAHKLSRFASYKIHQLHVLHPALRRTPPTKYRRHSIDPIRDLRTTGRIGQRADRHCGRVHELIGYRRMSQCPHARSIRGYVKQPAL